MGQCLIQTVAKVCRNIGGITDVTLILPGSEDLRPAHYCNSIVTTNYQIVNGQTWLPQLVKNSGNLEEQQVITDRNGDYFDVALKFSVKRNSPNLTTNINVFKNRLVDVLVTDRNGERYMLYDLRVQTSKFTGNKRSDQNGVDFLLKGKSKKAVFFF